MKSSLSLLVAAASLLSSSTAFTFKSERILANFDELQVAPAAYTINAVGNYLSLAWSGLSVAEPHVARGDDEFTGVEVKTEPNYIGGAIIEDFAYPSISADYPGSKVAFFDLERFYWGCSTTHESTGRQVPGWCTLEIYGYAHGAKEPTAKAVSFFFPKDEAKSMKMVEAKLPSSFRAVSRVEFNVLATNPILYLDDVQYLVYNVTDMAGGLSRVVHEDAGKMEGIRTKAQNVPMSFEDLK